MITYQVTKTSVADVITRRMILAKDAKLAKVRGKLDQCGVLQQGIDKRHQEVLAAVQRMQRERERQREREN